MSRYTFGGDEHLFVEVSEEMSLEAFFKSLATTKAIRAAAIPGITEICPANASFQIRFDPDIIGHEDLVAKVQALESGSEGAKAELATRVIVIPVYYDDPWTRETRTRFDERHQEPGGTDLAYAARINGYDSEAAFVAAHSGAPWFVSMVGFVAGLPFMYQMVDRDRQIEAPKYLRPRTDTPKLTVGHGGCFGCIYSVRGAGGYQMFGVTPLPIYDPEQHYNHLSDFLVLFRPGDIVRFKPVDHDEYIDILAQVNDGSYRPSIHSVTFSLEAYRKDPEATRAKIMDSANA